MRTTENMFVVKNRSKRVFLALLLVMSMVVNFSSLVVFAPNVAYAQGETPNDPPKEDPKVEPLSVVDPIERPSCAFDAQPGRTVVEFTGGVVYMGDYVGPESVSLVAGDYDVYLMSYDGYDGRGADVAQQHESWYVSFMDGSTEVAQSVETPDIPDGVDQATVFSTSTVTLGQSVESIKAKHAPYPGTNSVRPICAAFDLVEEKPEEKGSLTVCKLITDDEGEVATDGSEIPDASFGVDISTNVNPGGGALLETVVFDTDTFDVNTDLLGDDQLDDAECRVIEDLDLGSYYYSEEGITGGDEWADPKYNDQFSTPVNDLDNFFPYSGELFTPDPSDDDSRNQDADGHIVLTEDRPDRTLVLLNTFEKEELGCVLELTKTDDHDPVLPGDELVYTVTLANTGDANCTGGGVKLYDTLDSRTTYVSHEITEHDASEGSTQINNGSFIFNFGTMIPGSSVEIEMVTTVSDEVEAGDVLENTAHFWSNQTGTGDDVIEDTLVTGEDIITIAANKVVCESEEYLPNWGAGILSMLDENTINDFLDEVNKQEEVCWLEEWDFQWAPQGTPNPGDNTGAAGGDWTTFTGTTTIALEDLGEDDHVWVREVWNENYIPFTGANTTEDESAEMYCHVDALNYDNYDRIDAPFEAGETYYCAAFNVEVEGYEPECSDGIDNDQDGLIDYPEDLGCEDPNDDDENDKPVITVLPENPMTLTVGDLFTDPGATASDTEDGDITADIVVGGDTVNTSATGTYLITYNVEDSEGLAADEETRTVNVVEEEPECSDGIDNDEDGLIDYPEDLGCSDPNDDDENDKPIITVLGNDPLDIILGGLFTDPGATATDTEDGDITADIVVGGDTVNTSATGTYTITYNVEDSEGLAADEKTRTVNVNPEVTECNDGIDNDEDGTIDYPEDLGCDSPEDNDENDKPVITLVGGAISFTVGGTYSEPGYSADDTEDGDITADVVVGGDTVNGNAVGTYTITYNVEDSEGLAADQKTRNVHVTSGGGSTPAQCEDGRDNDGDGYADYPADPGCDNSKDNDESDSGPTLTVLGDDPITVVLGGTFTDPGASAHDNEDGDISGDIVVGGDTVDTTTQGSYVVTYNVSDSDGYAAPEGSRVVNVVPAGSPTPTLAIFNEAIDGNTEGEATITWNTNLPATSRVVYDTESHSSVGTAPDYDYTSSSPEDTTLVTTHTVTLTDLIAGAIYYFRPVSNDNSTEVTGIEMSLAPQCTYLEEYMRLGADNNPEEVTKLQVFLNDFENAGLAVSGFFDLATDGAVRDFQEKYRSEVLDPWGLLDATGYVYYTTQKQVNEIYCAREFPLDTTQLDEIADFFALIQTIQQGGAGQPELPLVGTISTGQPGSGLATTEGTGGEVAGASATGQPGSGLATAEGTGVPVELGTEGTAPEGVIDFNTLLAALGTSEGELAAIAEDGGTTSDEVMVATGEGTTTEEEIEKKGLASVVTGLVSDMDLPISLAYLFLIFFIGLIFFITFQLLKKRG